MNNDGNANFWLLVFGITCALALIAPCFGDTNSAGANTPDASDGTPLVPTGVAIDFDSSELADVNLDSDDVDEE